MNLLSLIIIFLALVIAGSVFFIAWELSSGRPLTRRKEEPGAAKGSKPPPDSKGAPD